MGYNTDSIPPASPASQTSTPTVDNVVPTSNARTSTTLDIDEEKETWAPTATFIRPFEYNEWEEWDGQSGMCTTEGSLDGYGRGDEESRISHYVHPTRFEPRAIGTRVPVQVQGSRRRTVTSTKDSDQLTFDFDASPAFRGAVPLPSPPPLIDKGNRGIKRATLLHLPYSTTKQA